MAKRKKYRGVSIGTVVMLLATCAVILGFAAILPKLGSNTDVTIDTGKVLQALSLGDGLPELSLSEIPISVTKAASSGQTATSKPTEPVVTPMALFQPIATAAPVATAAPTATPVPGGRFTATFGGSIIVNTELRQDNYYKESKKYDFSDILSLMKNEFTADLSMVTLENIIFPEGKLSDTNTTEAVLPMLSSVGIDMVALGYRNAYDLGMNGFASTIAAAKNEGMTVVGAYADEASASLDQRIVELGGVKVAVLHY
ncbi:MAG: CapA family protein, partial [Clostridia bacterium]|nr:CapA family protein [Clostridia bacterium]